MLLVNLSATPNANSFKGTVEQRYLVPDSSTLANTSVNLKIKNLEAGSILIASADISAQSG